MKRLILAVSLTLSASAFAQVCEVDMVDTRTNRRITSFRAYDNNDGCKEGMKQCRLEIRQRNLLNRADCVRATISRPNPGPNPNPGPTPYPGANNSRRMLNNGESAILNNKYVTVIAASFGGQYAVRSTDGWNTITNNVRREALSITNGCSRDLCTSDSVINIFSAMYVKVVGISFDDRFVIQSTDGWNTLSSNIERRQLAATKDCVASYYSQLCVGNTVIDNMNRYSTVVAIQEDGRVVLRSTDGWNTLSTNVDPNSLVVTR